MAEIENFLQQTVNKKNSPSVQYILFDKDQIIKKFASGLANISGNQPVNDHTTYNVFSVTKTFTAVAVLQLAEQKKLDLDKPVRNYLPGFPYPGEITARQLLSHTAGIPNPIPLSWIHLAAEHISFDRNKFFSAVFRKNPTTKPNQNFAYSNLGYVLLGQLIETVSGVGYENYITENILDTLAIKNEDLGFEIPDPLYHAKGYHKKWSPTNLLLSFFMDKSKYMAEAENGWKPFNSFYVNGVSYGGLVGKASAFVTYVQAMLQQNCTLLQGEYKRMMFTETLAGAGRPTGMCLSWFKGHLDGVPYFTHAGGGGGYYCEIRLYPETGIGSVVFFNRTGMSDERFLDKADRFYFQRRHA